MAYIHTHNEQVHQISTHTGTNIQSTHAQTSKDDAFHNENARIPLVFDLMMKTQC